MEPARMWTRAELYQLLRPTSLKIQELGNQVNSLGELRKVDTAAVDAAIGNVEEQVGSVANQASAAIKVLKEAMLATFNHVEKRTVQIEKRIKKLEKGAGK